MSSKAWNTNLDANIDSVFKLDAIRAHVDVGVLSVHAHVDVVLILVELEHIDVVLRALIDVHVLVDVVLILLLLDEIEIRHRSRTCATRIDDNT